MIRELPDLTVERARVRRAVPASRLHLETALGRISTTAVGVPSDALLLVRRLAPRAPLGPSARADSFVTDLHETLRLRLARARAFGSAGAEDDLLFRNDAELAAAVIASWLTGAPPEARGWQHIVTDGGPPPVWWRRHVLPDPRLLPKVIAALARQGRAISWLASLDTADVRQATAMLTGAHGIASAKMPALTPRPPVGQAERAPVLRAEIEALVPEAKAASLCPPARTLLTLALVLDRRPALAQTASFATVLDTLAGRGDDGHAPDEPSFVTQASLPPSSLPAGSTKVPDRLALPAGLHKPPPDRGMAVETRFGGLFFLLNALLAMDVYGDFTRPLAVSHAPDPFDLLALLGRRWFGRPFRDDPLDALLATLAGHEGEQPPRFAAPAWHLPDAWLLPWPDMPTDQAWHPAGFPIDLNADDARLPCRADARWLAALALYLRSRLARALDVPPSAAVRLTCRRPASITSAGDQVTAAFPLAPHPLALRLAGLDRDPGYLPAARREVRFMFT